MDMPSAEIVCLGNELLMGVTTNTNATFLGDHLTKIGYDVRRITCIRDDVQLAVDFFQEVFERKPNLIIITGGLGPRFPAVDLFPLALANSKRLEKFGA